MNFKFPFILLSLCLFTFLAKGQQELGLHFMKEIGQSNFTNPAYFSDHKLNINLTSPYLNFYHSGFTVNDVVQEIPGTDSLRLDFDNALAEMEDDNSLFLNFNLDLAQVSFQIKNLQLMASGAIKSQAYMNYSKTLVDVAWNGNAGYIGEEIALAPDFQAMSYLEIGIGAAYRFADKVSVGAKLKYLSGLGNFSADMDTRNISLYTDPDIYQITANANYLIQSAGYPELDSVFNVIGSDPFKLFSKNGGGNSGFAVDLGVDFQITDKLNVSASLIDMGEIKWKNKVNNYRVQGTYTYDGIDIGPLISGDTLGIESIGDTLSEAFDIKLDKAANSFSTKLPTKFYLSASYDVLDMLNVGIMGYGESYRGSVHPAVALSGRVRLGKLVHLGLIYSYRNYSFTNLGLNGTLKVGPVQAFLATDNVFPLFKPFDSRNFNLRGGLNIVLFKNKDKKKIEPAVEPYLED